MIIFTRCFVSTHSRLKAAGSKSNPAPKAQKVSTHSRLKAAGYIAPSLNLGKIRFNTQPPEGGWQPNYYGLRAFARFNTQPPEGGWTGKSGASQSSTGFNTQPPEGGWNSPPCGRRGKMVSTHSRLKAAGGIAARCVDGRVSFNTQPPEGGWLASDAVCSSVSPFQHTAA